MSAAARKVQEPVQRLLSKAMLHLTTYVLVQHAPLVVAEVEVPDQA